MAPSGRRCLTRRLRRGIYVLRRQGLLLRLLLPRKLSRQLNKLSSWEVVLRGHLNLFPRQVGTGKGISQMFLVKVHVLLSALIGGRYRWQLFRSQLGRGSRH